jgi:PAS domain S-box-containing protein
MHAERQLGRAPRWKRGLIPGESAFHRLLDRLPAGAYTCDTDGLITYYNPEAARLWGRAPRLNDPADRFCGSSRIFSADGEPLAHDECWMALALRRQTEFNGHELVIERPDGERITTLAHANPIHDENGTLLGAVNVLVDITDRKRAENLLRDADRAKNEFLATMSHEVRTPINAIMGFVDLLEVEVAGPLTEGQRGHLARVRAASQHLLGLVNDVLDLSKVEARQLVIRREPCHARHAAESALAVVAPLAAARGIALRTAAAGEPDAAYEGDEDRVRQMLINLLSNAIKFSEPGGRVELTYGVARPIIQLAPEAVAERWVRFDVRDGGMGIAPDQLDRIFEPFVQVEQARTRTRGGTGLGLTISRQLARLMGGDLTVESRMGSGSVFTLWLPISDDEPEPVAPLIPDELARSPAGANAALFAAAGHALLGDLDAVLRGYVRRLREERAGPGAESLSRAKLANHAATLLADVAATMLALEDGEGTTATFATGAEVQRVCAVEHGRQRAELGWDEDDVERDYAVLADEVERRLREHAPGDAGWDAAICAIRSRIDQAKAHSLRALQLV